MTINSSYCNSTDFIQIAETLIHELRHIDFKTTLISGWSNDDEYRAMWKAWVHKKYGIEYYNEHQIMVLEYMKLEANTLRSIDGNQFPYDHYAYIVWKGGLENDWEGAFSESTVDDWKEKYEKVQSNPNKYKCN